MMKVGDDDSYLVIKVIQCRNLSSDESYLVIKIYMIVKRSDDLWRFVCGDVSDTRVPGDLAKIHPRTGIEETFYIC